MAAERIQKLIARAGVASRRAAERLVEQGRVTVDGQVVTALGTKADPFRQRVAVNGRPLAFDRRVYLVLHKPRGVVSTLSDPEGRKTVASCVADQGLRVIPIGRLDYATSGVLLLTNDGGFARALAHPSTEAARSYRVKVRGLVDEAALRQFRSAIEVAGATTQPAKAEVTAVERDKTWLKVTLTEGKNRQIHRLAEAAGHPVLRLIRDSFAGVTCEGLAPGEWRYLSRQELTRLRARFGVPVQPRDPLDARVHGRARRERRSAGAPARKIRSSAANPRRR